MRTLYYQKVLLYKTQVDVEAPAPSILTDGVDAEQYRQI
jgi:hypothetical protein